MKTIAIISEGISQSSREISIRVSKIFTNIGYDKEIIFIGKKQWLTIDGLMVDKNDFSVKGEQKKTFDLAYIYSEGKKTKGYIQGYLSLLDIPYISSSPLATMLTTNKYFCKKHLEGFNILSPQSLKINHQSVYSIVEIIQKIGFPCIVKPNIGTDSFLVEKVYNYTTLENSIDRILEEDEEVLIEEFIEGRELTCGVVSLNGNIIATPVTEILVHAESPFYNYECKINRDNFKQIPAKLTEEQTLHCQNLSETIFEILECDDFIRIDYILRDSELYFLEANITPGISNRSHLPKQLNYMGIDLGNFFEKMIEQNLGNKLVSKVNAF